ncbi:MAG: hypothetical protein S4CHLAM107_15370 [Chlamydiia bacterium]|nr:hypothetical protein [Chlamydiia bacterium]
MKFLGLLLAASAVLFGQTYHNQDGNYAIKIGDDWKMQEEKESVAIFTKGSSLLTTMAMDLEKEPKLQEALQEEMRYIATGQLSTEETENYILQQLRLPMENAEIVAVNLDFSKAAEGVLKFSYLMEIDNNRVSVEQVQVVNNNRFMVFAATGECENADENAETLEVVLESVLETEEVVADVAEETEEVIADVEETEEVVADVAEEAEEVVADVEETEEVVADVEDEADDASNEE